MLVASLALTSAALALTASTPVGSNSALDGQDWTFYGDILYDKTPDPGAHTILYTWDANSAKLYLSPGANYVNHSVFFRALVVYQSSSVVWENRDQADMDDTVIDAMGTTKSFSPTSPFEGSETLSMAYKVQTGRANNTGLVAKECSMNP
jgi:hypothetical protein